MSLLFFYHSIWCIILFFITYTQNKQDRKCTCKRNIEARYRNHCCRAKARGVTYSECVCVCVRERVCVALVVHRAKRMRCVITSSVAFPVLQHFFYIIS